nr:reverse transcriptase domain-containing protein [Tanacetum cinerariifolium]
DRRFAAKGNGYEARDPRDAEVERLRQRIYKLETNPFDRFEERGERSKTQTTVNESEDGDDGFEKKISRRPQQQRTLPHQQPRSPRVQPQQQVDHLRSLGLRTDISEFEGRLQPDNFLDWLQTVERIFDLRDIPDHLKGSLPVEELIRKFERMQMRCGADEDEEQEDEEPTEVLYPDWGEILVSRRVLNVVPSDHGDDTTWLRNNIFRTQCTSKGNDGLNITLAPLNPRDEPQQPLTKPDFVGLTKQPTTTHVMALVVVEANPEPLECQQRCFHSFGRFAKLQPRADGPFRVLERINDNAYKINLPGYYGVSATFNVVDLAPYVGDEPFDDDSGTSKFDAKADDDYFLGYSFVSEAFRVFTTRRHQVEETYHVIFDESMKAIRFTNTSVDEIGIDDSSRYNPDEIIPEDDLSRQYQANFNISYYVIPHGRSLTKLTQEKHVPEVIALNEPDLPDNIKYLILFSVNFPSKILVIVL